MCPNEFKILANVKDILKNLANDFNFFAKVAKFRQIWSHCHRLHLFYKTT